MKLDIKIGDNFECCGVPCEVVKVTRKQEKEFTPKIYLDIKRLDTGEIFHDELQNMIKYGNILGYAYN